MKRGTPQHPKVDLLMFGLTLPRPAVVGHLELLWHFAARYAPRGDVGRFTDAQLAAAACWEGDPARFVRALVDCGWLDDCDEVRLVVHDWHDHADDTTRKHLKRHGQDFCRPVRTVSRQRRPRVRTESVSRRPAVAVPSHSQAEPLPEPVPPRPRPEGDPPGFDRDGAVREGYALLREIGKATGVDPQQLLREASTIKASGWYLLALDGAKYEHLVRTVDRLRDRAAPLRRIEAPPEPVPDLSSAPALAAEFLAWFAINRQGDEMQGQGLARWRDVKRIPMGPLAVAISGQVRRLTEQPVPVGS